MFSSLLLLFEQEYNHIKNSVGVINMRQLDAQEVKIIKAKIMGSMNQPLIIPKPSR